MIIMMMEILSGKPTHPTPSKKSSEIAFLKVYMRPRKKNLAKGSYDAAGPRIQCEKGSGGRWMGKVEMSASLREKVGMVKSGSGVSGESVTWRKRKLNTVGASAVCGSKWEQTG